MAKLNLRKLNFSFRSKLTAMVFVLIVTAVGGSAIFILSLYKKDKMSDALKSELSNINSAVSHLTNLLSLVKLIDMDRVRDSNGIILIDSSPCNKINERHTVLSSQYEGHFQELQINPSVWLDSLALFKTCAQLKEKKTPSTSDTELNIKVVPNKMQIMVPYLPVLVAMPNGFRFALLSLDGFQASSATTLFILDNNGNRIWSSDGDDFTDSAMADTGVTKGELQKFILDVHNNDASQVLQAGTEGIVSYAKLTPEWTLFSLSYQPVIFKPVNFAIRQSIYLALGFVFLCLFIGRNMAILLVRPLNELKDRAERLGKGDFSLRFQIEGDDEISVVKKSFNIMTEKMLALIEKEKAKIYLEKDLELAQEIQMMLIPESPIMTQSHFIHGYVKSADHCGGDWWGYLEVPRNNNSPLLIVIAGDVTGHGTPAALITATVRGGLSMLSNWIKENPEIADPRMISQYLNRTVAESAKGVIQMTLFTAMIDESKKNIYCSNAGHNAPYLLIPTEDPKKIKIQSVNRPGIPLGQNIDTTYTELDSYPWDKGSKLLLYTDGLIDCFDGEKQLFGRKQLRKAIDKFGSLEGGKFLSELLKDRQQQIGNLPPADDVTAVVVEMKAR